VLRISRQKQTNGVCSHPNPFQFNVFFLFTFLISFISLSISLFPLLLAGRPDGLRARGDIQTND
jgi:hypothetical protein